LAYNDGVAVRVIEASHEAELAVPDAVAVLGVDNNDALALMCDPPLSSVMVAAEAIGYRAARAVLTAARGGHEENAFLPPLGVVTRQSTDVFATSDRVVVRALRFIAEHALERPKVSEVARFAGINRRALERRFQDALERSPFEEIRRVQVLAAQELLAQSEMPLSLVAERAGFSGGKHFSLAFSRACGVSPSTYRKRQRVRSDHGFSS
jgi:LacI family transcriptional regulator